MEDDWTTVPSRKSKPNSADQSSGPGEASGDYVPGRGRGRGRTRRRNYNKGPTMPGEDLNSAPVGSSAATYHQQTAGASAFAAMKEHQPVQQQRSEHQPQQQRSEQQPRQRSEQQPRQQSEQQPRQQTEQQPRQRSEHQPQGNVTVVSKQELEQHTGNPTTGDLRPPVRRSFGERKMKTISLTTNHYETKFNKDNYIIHYDVQIPPKNNRVSKGVARVLVDEVASMDPTVFDGTLFVFDGVANLFTPKPLPLTDTDPRTGMRMQTWRLTTRRPPMTVTLKHVATIQLADIIRFMNGDTGGMHEMAINAVNNVFRQVYLQRPDIVGVGRGFYIRPSGKQIHLGEGRDMWYGFTSSALVSRQKTLNINIDMTATTFFVEKGLVDFVKEIYNLRSMDYRTHLKEWQIRKLYLQLKGMKVEYEYRPQVQGSKPIKRCKRVTAVASRGADCEMFKQDDGSMTSVANYFASKHNIKLQFPKLPCIVFTKPKIPLEFCTLLQQRADGRTLSGNQTKLMIREASLPPAERKRQIQEQVRRSQFANNEYAQAFGIEVDPEMIALSARVLPCPTIQYRDGRTIDPRGGSWNIGNLKFIESVSHPIEDWGIVNFCERTNQNHLQDFLKMVLHEGRKLGMTICQPSRTDSKVGETEMEDYFAFMAKKGINFLICVIPDVPGIYDRIKYFGNIRHGIVTSCVKSGTLFRICTKPNQTNVVGNILKKINAKLGGINHLPFDKFLVSGKGVLTEPTIVFGADVTHPAPGDGSTPSIAAVTASLDPSVCKYSVMVSAQKHRQEIIDELQSMAKKLILAFCEKNDKPPRKIIFYRDGVGEGQHAEVLRTELSAIRAACLEINPGHEPGVTLLLVKKRHHTRFFPLTPKDGDGRKGNVPAGTLVDTKVTHPTDSDFFLCSQDGIQGTSKPAHYHVLWDDNDLSPDDIEALTYYLCHCYSNCSKSVSNPAPAYYAHKAADLAMSHLKYVLHSDTSSVHSGSSGSSVGEPTDEMKNAVNVHQDLSDMMYFL